ncbi:MAG TPA: LysM peptidoglycan-binding domain-containing protein [Gammaproteobacteria bacterium]
MLFDQGKLEKMTIRALLPQSNPDEPPQVSDAPADTYVVQVNPSSYTLNHLLNYSYRQGQGFSGSEAVYNNSEPTTLSFEFLFDATGVVPAPSELGDVPLIGAIASALSGSAEYNVKDEIEKFNRVVYDYAGEIHRPRQLLLVWGTLVFPCALTSLNYRFTLFKPDGTPLRAIASCSFREAVSDAERERADNSSSPDLTHLRAVREGDSLSLMAYRIYGDAAMYLEVARVNKLVNFRRLRAGSRLAFPPIDKNPNKSQAKNNGAKS